MTMLIKHICADVNRRIITMNYETQVQLMDYLSDNIYNDKIDSSCIKDIADILGVNENCIFDLLSDLDLITEE